jgi:hypothetical protein
VLKSVRNRVHDAVYPLYCTLSVAARSLTNAKGAAEAAPFVGCKKERKERKERYYEKRIRIVWH